MSDGTLVERLQQDVADRQPVDWAALLSDLQKAEDSSEDLLRDVSLLQLLDEIGQAHGTFQSDPLIGDEPLVIADDTLKAWGRYVLEAKVGRGGFGSVYRAWDPVLEMPVALKILHRRHSDERLKERLLHEGRALAQLRHPNVVRVLNVEQHDGRFGLVMEFLSGETMDALLAEKGPLNDREAALIVEDVCRALVAVHSNNLIHRDVKARNIIRERAGRIVLMDFGAGLSTQATEDSKQAVGTPLYMSPETLAGKSATVASDVYSVGVLLFYLVTGRHPYEGESIDAIRDAQTTGRSQPLLGLRPNLPPAFVRVVDRALQPEPDARFATPAAMLQALVALRETSRPLKHWAAFAATAAVGLVLLILLGGIVATASFNATLQRGAFVSPSLGEWLEFGVRPLVMPIALALFGTSALGILLALRKALMPTSVQIRRFDRYLTAKAQAFARRFGLTDPAVCACWLLVLTTIAAFVVWLTHAHVWRAITSDISYAQVDVLRVFAKPWNMAMTYQRMLLTVIAAGTITGWYALARLTASHGQRLPAWFSGAELALLVLIYASLLLPYRIARLDEKFPLAAWNEQRCFVIGQRGSDRLLFCPKTSPRIHIAPTSTTRDIAQPSETLFASFASP